MATEYTSREEMRVRVTPKSIRIEHMTHWLPVRDAQEAKKLFSRDVIDELRKALAPGAERTPPNLKGETTRCRRTMVDNVRIERIELGRVRHYVTVPSLEAYLAICGDLTSAFEVKV